MRMKRIALLTAILMLLSQSLGAWAMGMRCAGEAMQQAASAPASVHHCHTMDMADAKQVHPTPVDCHASDAAGKSSTHHGCNSCQFCASTASVNVSNAMPSAWPAARGDWPPLVLHPEDLAPSSLIRPPAAPV